MRVAKQQFQELPLGMIIVISSGTMILLPYSVPYQSFDRTFIKPDISMDLDVQKTFRKE
jgi:hypothetical protein